MASSVIRRFSYDEAHRRLRVTFISGHVYDYDAVPPEWSPSFAPPLRKAVSSARTSGIGICERGLA